MNRTSPPKPSEAVCDFCDHPEPLWIYPARDFVVEAFIDYHSEGDWMACQFCYELIEAGEDENLTLRAVERISELQGRTEYSDKNRSYAQLEENHKMFRKNQTGSPYRWHGEPIENKPR